MSLVEQLRDHGWDKAADRIEELEAEAVRLHCEAVKLHSKLAAKDRTIERWKDKAIEWGHAKQVADKRIAKLEDAHECGDGKCNICNARALKEADDE